MRSSVLTSAAVSVAALLVTGTSAQADTLVLQQSIGGNALQKDVVVRQDTATNANTSFNSTTNAVGWVPAPGGGIASPLRLLQTWDLSSIPDDATINSVTLTLMHRSDTGASVDDGNAINGEAGDPLFVVRTISAPIVEPAIAPGNSTATGSDWNNTFGAGMTLGGTVLSSYNVDPEVFTSGDTGGMSFRTNVFGSSAEFAQAVQDALAGNQFNIAIMLANESPATRTIVQFGANSSDYPASTDGITINAPDRPILTIDYTPIPEPASIGLLASAGVFVLGRRRRS